MPAELNSYVYSISGLHLRQGKLSNTIVEDIDEFINIAPTLAENVRSSLFNRKDSYWFLQHMSMVLFLLKSVNAKWLHAEAEAILRAAEANHLDICRKKIEPFIADFLSLSIEMQMAQKRATGESGEDKKNVIEAYMDIANILTAVSRLIDNNEYDKARELLTDIEDLGDNTVVEEIMQSLYPSSAEIATKRLSLLRDKYISKIEETDSFRDITKKVILAVDDRPDVLRIVAGILRERYKVLTATDGMAALKILEQKVPDLFILDIDMPGMNGFELARKIRQTNNFQRTPILFLTSNSTREYVLKAIESGGSDFIVKPAQQSTLLSKVSRYLFT